MIKYNLYYVFKTNCGCCSKNVQTFYLMTGKILKIRFDSNKEQKETKNTFIRGKKFEL